MNNRLNHNETSPNLIQDVDFESKLLASQLVSEVRKSPGHVSFTFTGPGVLAFARAMQMAALEERSSSKDTSTSLFPDSDDSLITKKETMLGFNVSHTTLWKWQQSGYLIPVKVGKRVYYRRSDIQNLLK